MNTNESIARALVAEFSTLDGAIDNGFMCLPLAQAEQVCVLIQAMTAETIRAIRTPATARATYRGKYPNNVRAVWCGKDRIIHIETMSGERFTCDGAHARSINHVRLPNPGEDATPYRMPAVVLRAVYLHSAGRTCMVFENPENLRWSDCMVMDDHGNAVIVSDDFPHGLHPDDVACEA